MALNNYNFDIVGACEQIQREAADLAGLNYAYRRGRLTGALSTITAPENGTIESRLVSGGDGTKLATLHVLYDQRTKPCQITDDCSDSVCDGGTTPVRKEFFARINKCLSTPVRAYGPEDMSALCSNTREFLMSRAMSDLRAARESLDEKILAEYQVQVGRNHRFDGTTTSPGEVVSLDLIDNSGNQPIPLPGNLAIMLEDYMNNQLGGTPFVIGEGNFALMYHLQRMSCCNATTPYGEAETDGLVRFYRDQAANSILGANHVILGTFGSLRLATYNMNAQYQIQQADRVHITIPDPAGYPFSWDWDLYLDCDKVWRSKFSINWTVFNTFQNDSFADDGGDSSPDTTPDCADELIGMKGIFEYEATAASA